MAVTTSVLWQRSEVSRQKAEAETLRAEAGKLLVMGERELDRYPTGALAYTLKSLELADTEAARLLALRILQRVPVARIARVSEALSNSATEIAFSPDGEWVAWGARQKAEIPAFGMAGSGWLSATTLRRGPGVPKSGSDPVTTAWSPIAWATSACGRSRTAVNSGVPESTTVTHLSTFAPGGKKRVPHGDHRRHAARRPFVASSVR